MTNILFLCTADAARSQMAEGLARRLLGPGIGVASAGAKPAPLGPYAIAVLADLGIDVTGPSAKSLDALAEQSFDFVITLCTDAERPAGLAGIRHLHWPIDDPAAYPADTPPEAVLARFRRARDAITARLGGLVVELKNGGKSITRR